jgi:hypothetical protein
MERTFSVDKVDGQLYFVPTSAKMGDFLRIFAEAKVNFSLSTLELALQPIS